MGDGPQGAGEVAHAGNCLPPEGDVGGGAGRAGRPAARSCGAVAAHAGAFSRAAHNACHVRVYKVHGACHARAIHDACTCMGCAFHELVVRITRAMSAFRRYVARAARVPYTVHARAWAPRMEFDFAARFSGYAMSRHAGTNPFNICYPCQLGLSCHLCMVLGRN